MPDYTQYIDIDNLHITVNIKNGTKGDILLIHGLGCSKEPFDHAFMDNRLQGRRLIAPDLPGYGESEIPAGFNFSMKEYANVLKSLLAELKTENTVIIAHSMGGAIGLLLNDMLLSIRYFFCLEGNLIAEDCFFSRTIISETEDVFLEKFKKEPEKYSYRKHESVPFPDPVAFYRSCISLVELSDSGILLEKYLKLKSPKTYIYGEENRNTKAVEVLAGTDLIEIKGCGHFMLNDNPEQTYSEIEKRLAGIN